MPTRTPTPAAEPPRHLYLHVPYCVAKCPYCDFNSIAGRNDEHAAYVEALLTEVHRLPRGPYATIFVGGGTPTFLGADLLARLLAGVRAHVAWTPDCEWTVEANPGASDAERFAVLAEHGVNRISIGVQSTQAHHLRALGRVHDAAEAERAIALACAAVPRVSADLIFGVSGQTLAELDADLDLYARHGLRHASLYHLAYEPGTDYAARRARGELRDIDPGLSRAMFDRVHERLGRLGLIAYETSNFAAPGQESRHNLAYWRQADYAAAGAGAVSTIAGERLTREPHSGRYIAAISADAAAIWRRETLSPAERLREAWMLGLRLREGCDPARLVRLGDDAERFQPKVAALEREGLLTTTAPHAPGRIVLTHAGRPVQDEVTVFLMP